MEAFEEQLDRFIDMFELAKAENAIDEVVKKIEQMVEEQSNIVEKLIQDQNTYLASLASRERRQEENFEHFLEFCHVYP